MRLGTLLSLVAAASIAPHHSQARRDSFLQYPIVHLSVPNNRPEKRSFVSPIVDAFVANISQRMKDLELASIFTNAFPNSLDTTVEHINATDTFIITGDINAMWLRDSMNQVNAYMPLVKDDPKLQSLIRGLLRRHVYSILLDPYANAFSFDDKCENGCPNEQDDRVPKMNNNIFEGKFELDTLCATLRLSAQYFEATDGDDASEVFDEKWVSVVELIMDTITYFQSSSYKDEPNPKYSFERKTQTSTDTLMKRGRGSPGKRTGMARSFFRGSDDSTLLPFNIPANAMAVVNLKRVGQILRHIKSNELATRAISLANTIDEGIRKYGILSNTPPSTVYSYEVDGYMSSYFMDDANIPSLLALPYLGYLEVSDATYANTRRYVLSEANPYYFSGSNFTGVGGPHNGYPYVWPMALIQEAMSSTEDSEILRILDALKRAAAVGTTDIKGQGAGFMKESLHMNNASDFTRPWFAWCNSFFGELIVYLSQTRPHLLFAGSA